MTTVSVIIPAYNEQENIPQTIAAIPTERLRAAGYDVEILVVDNASTDGTGERAREHGARVLVQPVRGYGNAYRAGFANCAGDLIATGDADLTYPFEILPEALRRLETERLDFLNTDRLATLDPQSMTRSHVWGNHALSFVTRQLFAVPFRDSQSGMWIFRRHLLDRMRLRSGGMAFSQELKVEAYRTGFRCAEIPIAYYPRGGETKNRTMRDGIGNLSQLIAARIRSGRPPQPVAPAHGPVLTATVGAVDAPHANRHARD
ncbi:glycosyltransferase family 2 protein [Catenuloplanes sp. NPDC051500]|uniref:glycosyltransferase family 2 protein n=1 Tax=Catenuloplanes sp. NPDC051500 TaxID=3363959 RepID=UPI0037B8E266